MDANTETETLEAISGLFGQITSAQFYLDRDFARVLSNAAARYRTAGHSGISEEHVRLSLAELFKLIKYGNIELTKEVHRVIAAIINEQTTGHAQIVWDLWQEEMLAYLTQTVPTEEPENEPAEEEEPVQDEDMDGDSPKPALDHEAIRALRKQITEATYAKKNLMRVLAEHDRTITGVVNSKRRFTKVTNSAHRKIVAARLTQAKEKLDNLRCQLDGLLPEEERPEPIDFSEPVAPKEARPTDIITRLLMLFDCRAGGDKPEERWGKLTFRLALADGHLAFWEELFADPRRAKHDSIVSVVANMPQSKEARKFMTPEAKTVVNQISHLIRTKYLTSPRREVQQPAARAAVWAGWALGHNWANNYAMILENLTGELFADQLRSLLHSEPKHVVEDTARKNDGVVLRVISKEDRPLVMPVLMSALAGQMVSKYKRRDRGPEARRLLISRWCASCTAEEIAPLMETVLGPEEIEGESSRRVVQGTLRTLLPIVTECGMALVPYLTRIQSLLLGALLSEAAEPEPDNDPDDAEADQAMDDNDKTAPEPAEADKPKRSRQGASAILQDALAMLPTVLSLHTMTNPSAASLVVARLAVFLKTALSPAVVASSVRSAHRPPHAFRLLLALADQPAVLYELDLAMRVPVLGAVLQGAMAVFDDDHKGAVVTHDTVQQIVVLFETLNKLPSATPLLTRHTPAALTFLATIVAECSLEAAAAARRHFAERCLVLITSLGKLSPGLMAEDVTTLIALARAAFINAGPPVDKLISLLQAMADNDMPAGPRAAATIVTRIAPLMAHEHPVVVQRAGLVLAKLGAVDGNESLQAAVTAAQALSSSATKSSVTGSVADALKLMPTTPADAICAPAPYTTLPVPKGLQGGFMPSADPHSAVTLAPLAFASLRRALADDGFDGQTSVVLDAVFGSMTEKHGSSSLYGLLPRLRAMISHAVRKLGPKLVASKVPHRVFATHARVLASLGQAPNMSDLRAVLCAGDDEKRTVALLGNATEVSQKDGFKAMHQATLATPPTEPALSLLFILVEARVLTETNHTLSTVAVNVMTALATLLSPQGWVEVVQRSVATLTSAPDSKGRKRALAVVIHVAENPPVLVEENEVVRTAITNTVIPKLLANLVREKKGHKDKTGVKKTVARVVPQVASTLAALTKMLPEEMQQSSLRPVLLKLVTNLKATNEVVREGARTALCDVAGRLGPSFLPQILQAIVSQLKQDRQRHVAVRAVSAVSSRLMSEGASVDGVRDILLECIMETTFGVVAEQKNEIKFTQKTKDAARTGDATEIARLVGAYGSLKDIQTVSAAIIGKIDDTLDESTKQAVRALLEHMAVGISRNTNDLDIIATVKTLLAPKTDSAPAPVAPARRDHRELEPEPRMGPTGAILRAAEGASPTQHAHLLPEFGLDIFARRAKGGMPSLFPEGDKPGLGQDWKPERFDEMIALLDILGLSVPYLSAVQGMLAVRATRVCYTILRMFSFYDETNSRVIAEEFAKGPDGTRPSVTEEYKLLLKVDTETIKQIVKGVSKNLARAKQASNSTVGLAKGRVSGNNLLTPSLKLAASLIDLPLFGKAMVDDAPAKKVHKLSKKMRKEQEESTRSNLISVLCEEIKRRLSNCDAHPSVFGALASILRSAPEQLLVDGTKNKLAEICETSVLNMITADTAVADLAESTFVTYVTAFVTRTAPLRADRTADTLISRIHENLSKLAKSTGNTGLYSKYRLAAARCFQKLVTSEKITASLFEAYDTNFIRALLLYFAVAAAQVQAEHELAKAIKDAAQALVNRMPQSASRYDAMRLVMDQLTQLGDLASSEPATMHLALTNGALYLADLVPACAAEARPVAEAIIRRPIHLGGALMGALSLVAACPTIEGALSLRQCIDDLESKDQLDGHPASAQIRDAAASLLIAVTAPTDTDPTPWKNFVNDNDNAGPEKAIHRLTHSLITVVPQHGCSDREPTDEEAKNGVKLQSTAPVATALVYGLMAIHHRNHESERLLARNGDGPRTSKSIIRALMTFAYDNGVYKDSSRELVARISDLLFRTIKAEALRDPSATEEYTDKWSAELKEVLRQFYAMSHCTTDYVRWLCKKGDEMEPGPFEQKVVSLFEEVRQAVDNKKRDNRRANEVSRLKRKSGMLSESGEGKRARS
ncbi:Down-regulated in metastasis [Carpediemonas membranifera]|uniref:Down-regulated in metastasis n=1 Tax=Carpediemonas membranifera TaxID=201153 RepID=A0A8J6E1C7_9EUKA|nr:Down-regulated in metastasis [Carpediemonas membranifera]|eukprot:KAG9393308.1 Down-regulated in metastasis [Carpediemonas membranifera]